MIKANADWAEAAGKASAACEAALASPTKEAMAEAARLSWAVAGMIEDDGFFCESGPKKHWTNVAKYWQRCAEVGDLQ